MAVLSCGAVTCVYNKDELCSKGDIRVGGSDAHHSDQTCCESFKERTSDSMSNSEGCGCTTIGIDCKAQECSFNDKCKCVAGAINISGDNACRSEETRCSTFRCECK